MTRLAIIKKEKCKPDLCAWECKNHCPINMTGGECITQGEDTKANIDEILCSGCGICPKVCPFDALTIINLPDLKNKKPIHQFGLNGFRIFDLPILQENSITGIIGRNGIGKSTVINVLSNTIKANFSKFGEEKIKNDEEYFKFLNDLFKGSALQNYFNKLSKKEIKVSYKPQQIINIPQMFKGNVIELFQKITKNKTSQTGKVSEGLGIVSKKNSLKKIEKITKELNIFAVLNRDISVLSGGELQRVAIAAALLKENTNLYVFDEITNYLDIYERLNSSKLIKKEVEGKTALIVEHDLVVLDYLTEFCHIMYGQPSAYGMLTGIKSSKVGINSYLEGFSKEENVRFRDKPITFDKESVGIAQRIDVLAKWKKSQVEVGDFKLDVQKGDIKRGEIIGIIGRNALGKSTFIKNIDSVGLGDEIVISYKPQLIPKDDSTVAENLIQFKNYTDNFYEIYVLEPLNISPLLEKTTESLSGGELQRYAIAKCLLQESHLYLLDEPTAFLDIEDRLKIAKMLKNFMSLKDKSAFIIDHDLIFMDYLSDKLLVFSGVPSLNGISSKPLSMRDGMNKFLKDLDITFRRDESNKRPRVNKKDSVKDSVQKKSGEYYYS